MNGEQEEETNAKAAPAEEYVNTPLKPDVKSALAERAAANGRAVGREAAAIITKSVMRSAAK